MMVREDMSDDEADELARIEYIEQEDREDEESRPGFEEPKVDDDEEGELPRNEA